MEPAFQSYIQAIDEKRKPAFLRLVAVIDRHIPNGFEKGMQFGFPSYFVPLERYPKGYRGDKNVPLPFLSIGVQKHYISLYHLGIYADQELLRWFQEEYAKTGTLKLNMGKSCIRFGNPEKIPFELVGELMSKMSVEDWITVVENQR